MEGTPTTTTSLSATITTTTSETTTTKSDQQQSTTIASTTPIKKRPKANCRSSPYSILLSSDRSRARKRKSLSWFPDDKIQKIHYFEHFHDERVNVHRLNEAAAAADAVASGLSVCGLVNDNNKLPNQTAGGKISGASVDPIRRSNEKGESDKCIEYSPWRSLILIDFSPELPAPGWLSVERSAQAERETYVLGAIDLPGQTMTLDEPDQQPSTGNSESSGSNSETPIKVIPLDNPEGVYTEYPDMYASDIVNGIKLLDNNAQASAIQQTVVQNLTPFCNQQQQQQLMQQQNQYQQQQQQQLAHATQNAFNFQDMGAQAFQQQAQMPLQFPQFQQPTMPFANQQQPQIQSQQQPQSAPFVDQTTGATMTGPIMPWLSYPFNQVSENSHAHLFRRPAT